MQNIVPVKGQTTLMKFQARVCLSRVKKLKFATVFNLFIRKIRKITMAPRGKF